MVAPGDAHRRAAAGVAARGLWAARARAALPGAAGGAAGRSRGGAATGVGDAGGSQVAQAQGAWLTLRPSPSLREGPPHQVGRSLLADYAPPPRFARDLPTKWGGVFLLITPLPLASRGTSPPSGEESSS